MDENSRIKDKVRALLAKAQGTEIKAEADTFMAKAAELMERHQLDLHDLGQADEIGMTPGVTAQPGPPSYKSDVQVALARYYGARPILKTLPGKKWVVEICGPESSRVTTELMTDFVWKQVCTEAGRLSASTGINKQAAIREVAKALCYRIRIEVAARKETGSGLAGTSRSLLVVDATESWIEAHYPDLVSMKKRPKFIAQAAIAGAKNISLNHQAGNGASRLRLQ